MSPRVVARYVPAPCHAEVESLRPLRAEYGPGAVSDPDADPGAAHVALARLLGLFAEVVESHTRTGRDDVALVQLPADAMDAIRQLEASCIAQVARVLRGQRP